MPDETIETLAVKFKFVEESLNEIKQGLQSVVKVHEDTQKEITAITERQHVDLKAISEATMKTELEISGKTIQEKLTHQKEYLENLKKMLQSSNEFMSDEGRKVANQINQDLDNVNAQISQTKDKFGGLKDVVRDVGQELGITKSEFFEMFSVAGLVALTFEGAGRAVEHLKMGREFSARAGHADMSRHGARELEDTMTELVNRDKLTENQANSIMGKMMSIQGVGIEDLTKGGKFGEGLAREAVMAGRSIGQGPEGAIDIFTTMIHRLQVPINQVTETFDQLRQRGVALGDTQGEYIRTVVATSEALRSQNVDMGVTSDLIAHFWKELQEGRVSLDQVRQFATVGSIASTGQLAFMGQIAASQGSPELQGAFAGSPTAAGRSEITRRILRGEGASIDPADPKNTRMQEQLLQSVFSFAQQRATETGETGAGATMIEMQMIQSLTGLNLRAMNPMEAQEAMKQIAAGKFEGHVGEKIKGGLTGPADPMQIIADNTGKLLTPLQMIVRLLEELAKLIGSGIASVVTAGMSSPGGKRIHEMAGESFATASLEMMSGVEDLITGKDNSMSASDKAEFKKMALQFLDFEGKPMENLGKAMRFVQGDNDYRKQKIDARHAEEDKEFAAVRKFFGGGDNEVHGTVDVNINMDGHPVGKAVAKLKHKANQGHSSPAGR